MEPDDPEIQTDPDAETKRKLIKLMRRVPKRSYLREMINAETGEVRNTPENVTILLDILEHTLEFNWRERRIAAIALGTVTVEGEQERLAASILGNLLTGTDIRPAKRLADRTIQAFVRTGLWATLWGPLMVFCSSLFYDGQRTPVFAMFALSAMGAMLLLSPAIFILSPVQDTVRNNRTRAEAVNSLARLEIPESIGVLAISARSGYEGSDVAREALLRIIPKLTPEHYGQMPPDTTPELCALLNFMVVAYSVWPNDFALLGSLLDALEMVGDGRAVEPLKQFAERVPQKKFRERAEAILPILMARREQENNSASLLRGSAAPPSLPAELLRPAAYSTASEPEQLLRAGIGPNNDTGPQT